MPDKSEVEQLIHELRSELKTGSIATESEKKPIKKLLAGIYDSILYFKEEKQKSTYVKSWDVNTALNALAFVAFIVFIFTNGRESDSDFIESIKFPAYCLYVILSLIWVGVQLERIAVFKELWSFGVTKIVFSLSVTALLVYCSSSASSLINGIFGVDASALPYTKSFLTGLVFFQYIYKPLMVLLIFIGLAHFLHLGIYAYYKINEDQEKGFEFPVNSLFFVIFIAIVCLFTWKWNNNYFDVRVLNNKIYSMARNLDFNESNACSNLRGKHVALLFLGQNQKDVLMDFNVFNSIDLKSLITDHDVVIYDSEKIKLGSCVQ
ncbi:hypothetical protein VRC07_19535 [Erwinia sp. E_sp_B04_8]|uniref:hypothetical protein n=1 Tax=unclassified Erwinia TaxID=2622719 RepID=UPI0030CAB05D